MRACRTSVPLSSEDEGQESVEAGRLDWLTVELVQKLNRCLLLWTQTTVPAPPIAHSLDPMATINAKSISIVCFKESVPSIPLSHGLRVKRFQFGERIKYSVVLGAL